jgi:DNA-binding MarR family transcriptional regulator
MGSEDGKYAALERELSLMMRRGPSLAREVAEEVHPDLDAASFSTFSRISETAPARASDLVEYFGIDKAAVSRQILGLEQLGLVERTEDPQDGRARAVRLTERGATRLRQVLLARNARFRELVGAWPPEDIDELARLMGMLNRLL